MDYIRFPIKEQVPERLMYKCDCGSLFFKIYLTDEGFPYMQCIKCENIMDDFDVLLKD